MEAIHVCTAWGPQGPDCLALAMELQPGALDAAAARRGSTETETETEEDDRRRDGTRARSREGVSSSFDVAVFARERHVPRGRVARREFEERVDAFLADAFE